MTERAVERNLQTPARRPAGPLSGGSPAVLGDADFAAIRKFVYQRAGISLSEAKRALVSGRLDRRLREIGCTSYSEYLERIGDGALAPGSEAQVALDLLTTNETYFFREQKHFDFLRERILQGTHRGVKIWSAACSSGEEPYSIAMLLADALGQRPWSVFASDVSSRVLARARLGQYPMERADRIPRHLLHAHCLRGVGSKQGWFAVSKQLRERIEFRTVNLIEKLPEIGPFDVVFLRNVMIYFDHDTKRAVCKHLLTRIRPGGYLFVGHSENLHGICDELQPVSPSIYRCL
ncbi:MAG: protein-glutamate O-methyltransferase CheR [Acidihalobacter sp.]|uniref:CheR family methyltransferase n=1 Tax=Acidihalobacter sp. TaxID=1872108 RepID=UPI00307DC212